MRLASIVRGVVAAMLAAAPAFAYAAPLRAGAALPQRGAAASRALTPAVSSSALLGALIAPFCAAVRIGRGRRGEQVRGAAVRRAGSAASIGQLRSQSLLMPAALLMLTVAVGGGGIGLLNRPRMILN